MKNKKKKKEKQDKRKGWSSVCTRVCMCVYVCVCLPLCLALWWRREIGRREDATIVDTDIVCSKQKMFLRQRGKQLLHKEFSSYETHTFFIAHGWHNFSLIKQNVNRGSWTCVYIICVTSWDFKLLVEEQNRRKIFQSVVTS